MIFLDLNVWFPEDLLKISMHWENCTLYKWTTLEFSLCPLLSYISYFKLFLKSKTACNKTNLSTTLADWLQSKWFKFSSNPFLSGQSTLRKQNKWHKCVSVSFVWKKIKGCVASIDLYYSVQLVWSALYWPDFSQWIRIHLQDPWWGEI